MLGNRSERAPQDGDACHRPCLDCGASIAGNYCSNCGQKAHLHRSFGAIAHDLAHGVLHLEGKFWRTLPLLAYRPGDLTRRYIEGERTRFLSPTATFLLSVFLMFAVINTAGRQAYYAENRAERLAPSQTAEEADVAIDLDLHDAPAPLKKIDEAWRHAKVNPSLLGYKLQSNAYKFSWALIPICVPLVWLLFINRRRYRVNYGAYEHTVFVTYALAFMSLAAIALTLLKLTGLRGPAALIPLLYPVVHTFWHVRGAYRLSFFSALWRSTVLVAVPFLAGLLFFMFLLMSGLLG
jgi:hypothetical protein